MARAPLLVLVAVLAALGLTVVGQGAVLRVPGDRTGYAPAQPIAFSHALHAGEMQIGCQYCHTGTETSRQAGLPNAQTCMGCHRFVPAPLAALRAEEQAAQKAGRAVRPVVSPEIAKLYRAMGVDDAGKPVPGAQPQPIAWVRVHDLPDFATFDHRPHVAGGLACQACHGPVESMVRVRQHADLTMGWCVSCHRASRASGLPDGRPSAASTDCSVCHR
jgi:hypothetical protein